MEIRGVVRFLGAAAGKHLSGQQAPVAARGGRKDVNGFNPPPAGAIAENRLCADEPGDRILIPLDYVLDLSRRKAVQRVAFEVELPAVLAAPGVFPVRMDMEVKLVASARKRLQMAEHLVRFLLRARARARVLLELAQVTRIDAERELAGHSVRDFEQRLTRLEEAALRRAVTRADDQLVL